MNISTVNTAKLKRLKSSKNSDYILNEISRGKIRIAKNITTIVNKSHTTLILSSYVNTLIKLQWGFYSSYSFFNNITLIFLDIEPLLVFSLIFAV